VNYLVCLLSCPPDPAQAIDAGHRGETVEAMSREPVGRHGHHPGRSFLVPAIYGLAGARGQRRIGPGKQRQCIAMQRAAIALDRQRIVAAAQADRRRGAAVAMQGVGGDGGRGQVEQSDDLARRHHLAALGRPPQA